MIFMPKRSNPNSMIFMPKRDTIYMPRPNGMIMGKRGGPNSMIFMPKRFNPNSMILLPKRSNPNSMIFMPKRADDVAKRETDLDEFFTSRGKKSWLMPVSIITSTLLSRQNKRNLCYGPILVTGVIRNFY